MSALPLGIPVALAAGLVDLAPALFSSRIIGSFVADVTVEELANDELEITEHPIESGAAVTDHSYKRPSTVIIRAGWTNSPSLVQIFNGVVAGVFPIPFGAPNRVQSVYAAFLALQNSREPFSVVTGKRRYKSMLIHRLTEETTERSENALLLSIACREIIVVTTSTTTLGDPKNMKTPQLNASTQARGDLSLGKGDGVNAAAIPR